MTTFYEDMAAVAVELLQEFGAPVTFPRESGGSFDPITGVETPGSDDSETTIGLVKPYPEKLIDGTRIQMGDRMLVLSPEVEPSMDDKPMMGGAPLGNIVAITTSSPAGIPVCYFAQVRK